MIENRFEDEPVTEFRKSEPLLARFQNHFDEVVKVVVPIIKKFEIFQNIPDSSSPQLVRESPQNLEVDDVAQAHRASGSCHQITQNAGFGRVSFPEEIDPDTTVDKNHVETYRRAL